MENEPRKGAQWTLLGAEGRVGLELRRFAAERGLPSPLLLASSSSSLSEIISKIESPLVVFVFSIPGAAVKERLLELCRLREMLVKCRVDKVVVLDCSGVIKVAFPHQHLYRLSLISNTGQNGNLGNEHREGEERNLEAWESKLREWQTFPRLELVGNPGCMASAVINSLKLSGIYGAVTSPISVTAIGGKSYAPTGQEGQLRVGRRWLSHPHVAEIERATGEIVSSFVPVISYGLDEGLMVVVSGQCRRGLAPIQSDPPLKDPGMDAGEVLGTDLIRWRAECNADGFFTISAAIDNVPYVASLAAASLAEYFDDLS